MSCAWRSAPQSDDRRHSEYRSFQVVEPAYIWDGQA
jgi:hypothetical protein